MKGIIEVGQLSVTEDENMETSSANMQLIIGGEFLVLGFPIEKKLLIVKVCEDGLTINKFASLIANKKVLGRCVVLTGDDYKNYIK